MAGREDRKAELIAQLGVARARLNVCTTRLHVAADIPSRVRHNFSRHLFPWLGGATLLGVVLAKLPARKKKIYVNAEGKRVSGGEAAKAGLLITGLKLAFDFAKPTLMKMAAEKLKPMAEQYFARAYQSPRPPA